MKRSFIFLALSLLVFMFSCDPDKEASPLKPDTSKSATLKIYLYAELDLTSAGLESAPQGTKVLLSIPYNQLGTNSNGLWTDTLEANVNGIVEAIVPLDVNGATVTIQPLPFESVQIQAFGTLNSQATMIYTANQASYSLIANDYEVVQLNYNYTAFNNYVEFAEISGNLTAQLNDTISGEEYVASGVSFTLTATGWSKTATTGVDGSFTIEVPANMNINLNADFVADRVVWDTGEGEYLPVAYRYMVKNNYIGNFSGTSEGLNISVGSGTPVN